MIDDILYGIWIAAAMIMVAVHWIVLFFR